MSSYEQPDYSVVESNGSYEIRLYDSYLAAETKVEGDFDSVGNIAFRRLAGVIFGRNSEGRKMNMTVPVTRQETASKTYRYRFVIEKTYSAEDLPKPVDGRIDIVSVPAGYYAAIRYRGRRNEANYRRALSALVDSLSRDGVSTIGAPVSAVYDGPLTPPALRRNEVLIPVARSEADVS